jgi:hypothetical protein
VNSGGKVHWFHMGSWGMFVGYTSSQAAFNRALKRLKIKEQPMMVSATAGGTTHFFNNPNGELCALIALKEPNKVKPVTLAGIVVHEVAHVVRHLWRHIDEREPGDEAEAYLFQYLVIMVHEAIIADNKSLTLETGRRIKPT